MKTAKPAKNRAAPGKDQGGLLAKLSDLSMVLGSIDDKLSPKTVHRLRVATRRLNALIEVLSEAAKPSLDRKNRKSVKFLTKLLGEMRSLDVSLKLWREQLAPTLSKSGASLAFVEKKLREIAHQGRRRLTKKIGKKQREILEKTLKKSLSGFKQNQAAYLQAWESRCARAKRRAAQDYARYRAMPEIERLHELRIRLKEWRYLLELAPKGRLQSRIEVLKSLQDDIGELHDREVLRDLLGKDRMKRFAQKAGAGHDLKEVRRGLKSEIEGGQATFLTRQAAVLDQLFLKGETA